MALALGKLNFSCVVIGLTCMPTKPQPLNLGVPIVNFPRANAILARAQALLWVRDWLHNRPQSKPTQKAIISGNPKAALNLKTLKRIHNDYQRIVKSIQPKLKWTNLNSAEKHTIKALRKKDNIYLPSDKGGEFCVIDLQTYNEAALQHLEDPHTYRKIPRMSAKTVEGKINPVWKDICVRRNIPKFVKRSYVSNNTELPRFYHLVKTHKLEQGIKIRPIACV
jgi:hypothetical protein